MTSADIRQNLRPSYVTLNIREERAIWKDLQQKTLEEVYNSLEGSLSKSRLRAIKSKPQNALFNKELTQSSRAKSK